VTLDQDIGDQEIEMLADGVTITTPVQRGSVRRKQPPSNTVYFPSQSRVDSFGGSGSRQEGCALCAQGCKFGICRDEKLIWRRPG
jgi:hypothetical protein